MKQVNSVCCNCGNIECENITIKQKDNFIFSQKTLEHLNIKGNLLSSNLRPKSFVIHNQNQVQMHSYNSRIYGIECNKCKQTFFFFSGHSTINIAFSEDCPMVHKEFVTNYFNENSDLPKFHIPILLRSFIYISPEVNTDIDSNDLINDEIDPIDIDDDYMFSSTKIDCFVGSYEDRPMSLGSEYVPI